METIRVQLRGNKDKVDSVSGEVGELRSRLESLQTVVHRRIDQLANTSRDMSVDHNDDQQNLFQVRSWK